MHYTKSYDPTYPLPLPPLAPLRTHGQCGTRAFDLHTRHAASNLVAFIVFADQGIGGTGGD